MPFLTIQRGWRGENHNGFTLIELLVVIAIIAILAALLIPSLEASIERARIVTVRSELRQVEYALEAYYVDHDRYPPVRVSCNTDELDHWCQLPQELVQGGYLPRGGYGGMSCGLEDPFNRGRTYKYAAVVPYLLNGALQRERFSLYIPDDFPLSQSSKGRYWTEEDAPVDWVIWSLGPRQSREKALNASAPLSGLTWYRGWKDNGVIALIKPKGKPAFFTQ